MPQNKSQTLQQAASLVFTLTAILPLLTFAYTLIRLNGLREPQDQITLGLVLMGALTGFYVLRRMVTRMSDLLQAVGRVTEQGDTPAPAEKDLQVPGIGKIQEFHRIAETLWPAWKAEAEPYLGQRVLVAVKNSSRPIIGTVVEVTDDGVLLEEDGKHMGVSYRRVAAIEGDPPPRSLARATV